MNYVTQNQIDNQLTQIFINIFNNNNVYIKSIKSFDLPVYHLYFCRNDKNNNKNQLFNNNYVYFLIVPSIDFKCFTQNDLNTYITFTFTPYCNQAKQDYDNEIAMFL